MADLSYKLEKTHVAYIHETIGQSIARDLGTVAIFIVLWSFGYFIGSPALEWVGVLIGGMVVFGRAVAMLKGNLDRRMTPDQAREWLDEHFPHPSEQTQGE